MSYLEDEPTGKPAAHTIGEDLSDLSIEDLNDRIALLKTEIERIQASISAKNATAATAETFFKR